MIEIEDYEEVAKRELCEIRNEAVTKFELQEVTITLRTGNSQVRDDILAIVVSVGHRKRAFSGCKYILERIKERTPAWRRKILSDVERGG
ncbi:MAG: molybdenum cofactor biosynthesis protein MoaE [Methanomicrobiales archaeon]|nr:molybdenum cofactor biosynthesis protein MoaE [Methanomicrobiales archaeon]